MIKLLFHEEIGRGSFGKVYSLKVHDGQAADKVAIKVFRHSDARLAKQEIKMIKKLRHFAVVEYLGKMFLDHSWCLIMPYYDGDLSLIDAPEPELINSYMIQLLLGLQYLHKLNIVHRDLKPGNLLINQEGDLKIADFGGACKADDLFNDHDYCTINYRAPELFFQVPYGVEVDLWSVGVIFVEFWINRTLRTHRYPFDLVEQPTKEDWKYAGLFPIKIHPQLELELPEQVLGYAKSFLCWPNKRLTAISALEHSYWNDKKNECWDYWFNLHNKVS